jgi:hypothetical protein
MSLQAMSPDPAKRLILASNFQPDIDGFLSGNGLVAFGAPGSGKSNLLALLIEQVSRFHLPLVLLDTEGEAEDLLSALPRGVAADRDNLPDPDAILARGLQVVFDLKSYGEDFAAAGLALCELLTGLLRVASGQRPVDRVPCPIIMDEAALWLPRRTKQVAHLPTEVRTALMTTFERLGSQGRKYGLIPSYFTQYSSQIDADVVRGCGLRVLMKQTDPRDMKCYGDYLPMTSTLKATIQNFIPGEAIIIGVGDPLQVRFAEQKTKHPSHTPKVAAALAKFAPGQVPQQVAPKVVPHEEGRPSLVLTGKQLARMALSSAKAAATPEKMPTLLEKVFDLLDGNGRITVPQLAQATGVSVDAACIARQIWIEKRTPQSQR